MSPYADVFENLSGDSPIKATTIYQLSEPHPELIDALRAEWMTLQVDRRRMLMARLAETTETDFQVDFSDVALLALSDDDADVRQHALETLWTSDKIEVMYASIERLGNDPSLDVRVVAADMLGKFVFEGELGQIPAKIANEALTALLRAISRAPERSAIYLRALASTSYSSIPDVENLIEKASQNQSTDVRAAAILGMGRQGDSRWTSYILKSLRDEEPVIRFEAARAAGEAALSEAVAGLATLTKDHDREIKEMAIWALGEIGGADAHETLVNLADSEKDEDLLEAIEDAINMATVMSGDLSMYILGGGDDSDADEFDTDEDSALLN